MEYGIKLLLAAAIGVCSIHVALAQTGAQDVAVTKGVSTHTTASLEQKTQYVVQLGAFENEFQAVYWRKQLADAGIETVIERAQGEHGMMRIHTTPFQNKADAQAMALQLKLYGVGQTIVLPVIDRN